MHWIGAQFCACVFMDSRDKSVNMLSFCRNDVETMSAKERIIDTKKKENKKYGASLLWNPLTINKIRSLAS